MAIYNTGAEIRLARIAQGITQEELCNNICAVETLSRIENGKQRVMPVLLSMLAERLSLSYSMHSILTESSHYDPEWNRNCNLYSLSILNFDLAEAEQHLLFLKDRASSLMQKQYVAAEAAYIRYVKKELCPEEYAALLGQALRMTIPHYDHYAGKIFPYTLQECRYFMRLGSSYNDRAIEENDTAISLYRVTLDSINAGYMCGNDVTELYLSTLSNMCYVYSDTKQYLEAICKDEELLHLALKCDCGSPVGDALSEILWNKKQLNRIMPDQADQAEIIRLAHKTAYIAMTTKYTYLLDCIFAKNSHAWKKCEVMHELPSN